MRGCIVAQTHAAATTPHIGCPAAAHTLAAVAAAGASHCAVSADVEHAPHLVRAQLHKLAKRQVARQAVAADAHAPQRLHLQPRVLH